MTGAAADRHHRRRAAELHEDRADHSRDARRAQPTGGRLRYRLVHTGQHYDARMSGDFFDAARASRSPTSISRSGSGTPGRADRGDHDRATSGCCLAAPSDLCLVVGDVTSTMACAIAAQKLGVPVAHVEAGIRSGDWTMPEEINRMVTDAITNWFFTTSETANANLRRVGRRPTSASSSSATR